MHKIVKPLFWPTEIVINELHEIMTYKTCDLFDIMHDMSAWFYFDSKPFR